MKTDTIGGKPFLLIALILLVAGLVVGLLSAWVYVQPTFLKNTIGFTALRPMHVSLVTSWILLGASGGVMSALTALQPKPLFPGVRIAQLLCWLIALIGILTGYLKHDFGGREYWEFNPVWALPIAVSWLLYLVQFFVLSSTLKKWPVYVWMWMTGGVFFLFTFIENYLWLFPYFRSDVVADITIQWKVNGSLVGSWNQLIYGLSFYLMDRVTGDKSVGQSKMAFAMYFLGLFNLMFNWGHHIYTLPTASYIRYIGYAVSMTEWIFFIRILATWKQSLNSFQKYYHYFPYRFLMASEIWVFINMGQAILMSIPALNKYTHGTHCTVAHAMGTTIGINSMILLAACFTFFNNTCISKSWSTKWLTFAFWATQVGLLVFWIGLNVMGIQKGIWQNSISTITHHQLMKHLTPYFIIVVMAGFIIALGLILIASSLIYQYLTCPHQKNNRLTTTSSMA